MRALGRGAVVACFGALAVAWSPLSSGLWIALPIARHNVPRSRSDVILREMADLLTMGVPGGLWLIRAGKPCRVPVTASVLGETPTSLLAALRLAVERECAALRCEGSGPITRGIPP